MSAINSDGSDRVMQPIFFIQPQRGVVISRRPDLLISTCCRDCASFVFQRGIQTLAWGRERDDFV